MRGRNTKIARSLAKGKFHWIGESSVSFKYYRIRTFSIKLVLPHFINKSLTAGIDLSRLQQSTTEQECQALQEVLLGVAYCSLEEEFSDLPRPLPSGVVKLQQLSQLIIQYLIHCQKKLEGAVKALQRNNDALREVTRSDYMCGHLR